MKFVAAATKKPSEWAQKKQDRGMAVERKYQAMNLTDGSSSTIV
jgi:hypothetical protein